MAEADPRIPDPHVEEVGRDRGLDRRQLLKAGAWAAPVVLLAAAVPAAAASVAVPPFSIRLTADCASTVPPATRHGFKIENSSTATATVVVRFNAAAWGLLRLTAIANVISATSVPPPAATYHFIATPGAKELNGLTYQTLWETAGSISVDTTATPGPLARREGEAIFVLPPGGSIEFGQTNANVLGEPRITASVVTVNGDVVTGSVAVFGFELGGACIAT